MNKIFEYQKHMIMTFVAIIVVIFIGVIFKIRHYSYANELLILGLVSTFLLFLITLYDMIVSPIRKKGLWIFGLILSPIVVGLLYVFLRKDMIEIK